MHYASIKPYDIANGPGVRVSLFVSGCTHHCPGCFNEIAWDFDYGQPYTDATMHALLNACAPDYIAGLSLLGGEPLEPAHQAALLPLLQAFRAAYPDKTIWCYSGYTLEELCGNGRCRCDATDAVLGLIDVLVDGRFELTKKDISLRFRGSSNQRLIDLPATLASGEVRLWQDRNGMQPGL